MLVFHKKLFKFLEKEILKIGLFHRFNELFKSNQSLYEISHVHLECKLKRIFWYRSPGKKVAQIGPNLVWSIPCVGRV